MKKLTSILIALTFLLITQSANGQTRELGNFTALSASTSVSVTLIKSDRTYLEYKITKGNDEDLRTDIKGSTLIIKMKSKGNWGWSNNSKATVTVYYKSLDDISASAGATVKASDPIMADKMDIDVSSGASVDVEVEANRLEVDASSGASIKVEGNCDKAYYDASSGASIRARKMIAKHVNAEASSGASIKVHADESLRAEASSGGNISYSGEADDSRIDKGWSGQISRAF